MNTRKFLAYGTRNLFFVIAVLLALAFVACDNGTTTGSGPGTTPATITYTAVQEGGTDGTTTSTGIKFTFSASVSGLTAADITVSGAASKGSATLSGSGTSWTLPITVNNAGLATVSISKSGIEAAAKTVTVYQAGAYVPEYWTITWNMNGGDKGASAYPEQIVKGTTLAKPSPGPTKANSTFGGWYTDSGFTAAYNFANTVTANLTLYAKWEAGSQPPATAHTHQWGEWTATTITGTEQRVCAADQSHIEHRLTGTDRFTFASASDTSYRVSKGTATGEIRIPAYYRQDANSGYLPVTVISNGIDGSGNNNNAFGGTSITAVHIPDSVTIIRSNAFYNCDRLTSVTIGAGVTTIAYDAFYGCTSLTSITVDGNNPNYADAGESLVKGILYNKAKTTIIACPSVSGSASNYVTVISLGSDSGVTAIGDYAFWYGRRLASIRLPASVTSVGDYAFYDCTGLTSITFGENSQLQTIGDYAFSGCTRLTSFTIPAGVTTIAYDALFFGCTSLASITVDPNNSNYASHDGILYNKAKTTLIKAPAGISGNVTIPASVTSISERAFSGCTSLTSITIPASVTSVGSNTFSGWTSSQLINVLWTSVNRPSGWSYSWDSNCNAQINYVGVSMPGMEFFGIWKMTGSENGSWTGGDPSGRVHNETIVITSPRFRLDSTYLNDYIEWRINSWTAITSDALPSGYTSGYTLAVTLVGNQGYTSYTSFNVYMMNNTGTPERISMQRANASGEIIERVYVKQ